ncbi:MAG: peptidoglycan DD-metalloendopeptidase family protein [Schwartzia sp.]|nr:peptidoglycan DD-metalloendopeptidase family protein [Schwartzia sp. (in: firmicutes)]
MEGPIHPEEHREYTIKIIPHQGETVHSIRLSRNVFKYGLASLAAGALLFVGAASFAVYSSFSAVSDAQAISELQQVNTMQQEQLAHLAKKANALQDEMDQLHQVEQELQQLSGTAPATEEAEAANHDGQGGPWVEPDVKNVNRALDSIHQRLERSRRNLEDIRAALQEQQQFAINQDQVNATIPSIWPASGEVSSPYGLRWGGSDFHPGIDIANDYGTPILAAADGVVTTAGWNSGGYGNMVDIDHGNGIMTRYGHAEEVVVSAGQTVRKGQIIAFMGSTGFSTGPHVHYEVHMNGDVINPIGYLR